MDKDKIIIIPVHNEKLSLKKVIKECIFFSKILVVDDGSADGTSSWLKNKKIPFIKNKKKSGYEISLIKGFKKLLKNNNIKYIITLDGDGEHNPKYLNSMMNIFKRKRLDLLIGERNKLNRFSEKVLSAFFFLRYGVRDPISGYKIYSSKALKKIINKIKLNSFLVDIIPYFRANNCKIENYKIKIRPRIKSQPKVGKSFFVNFKILKILRHIL